MSPQVTTHCPWVHELTSLSALAQAIKNDTAEVARGFIDQRSRRIMTWISTLNFSTKQNDIFSKRQEGTGEWLLEDDTFKNWLDGTERTLWCPGPRMIFPFEQL